MSYRQTRSPNEKNILKVFIVCFGVIFFLDCAHDKGAPLRIGLDLFEAFPGDKRIYLQWHYLEEGYEIESIFIIYRIEDGKSKAIGAYSVYHYLYGFPMWGIFLDTTCSNGERYSYYLYASDHPVSYFSDTIYATSQQGLPDPVPPSPESLWVEQGDSSFTLKWISPQGHDSLYYIYRKDSSSTRWYTVLYDPIKLSNPEYTLEYVSDTYFKIAVFVDGVLSLPSDSVEATLQK